MSRFFDLLQRLNQSKSASAPPVAVAPENSDVGSQLDQTLSAFLAREASYPPQFKNGFESDPILPMLLAAGSSCPEDVEQHSDLERTQSEKIVIRPESRIVFHTHPSSPGADRFRLLRMRLRALKNARKLKTLLITSPSPGDGKSTIALNLATALTEGGKLRVLLIEADLHRSPLALQLGIEGACGVAECLENGLNPLSAVRRLQPLGWYLLPAGKPHTNPTELLQGEALGSLMQRLSIHFDWILIDSPPVIPLTDALSLGRHANGSLLVMKSGQTNGDALERAITLLGRDHLLAMVLNAIEDLDELYRGYYQYAFNSKVQRQQ